ncbi:hypothetical protein [Ulvibacter litoralis]|uniref:Uncharacterized protein n=1 Tax=Ulvibacter litoralis TaxID=227084 RepID=A0A1G7DCY2_9FLAO|nr:hypothetical protein [Ulvibacter litoralis]GHC43920.1 hypothetical protein GCM10008083_03020 [Ulvibacter litoralis]SDE49474.1 hypothetical protein SAMN05421855_101906 [Ulvibacter litoralis]
MIYRLKGKLFTAICDAHENAIAHTKVRLYSLKDDINAATAYTSAQSKELIQIFEAKEIKNRKAQLIAETTTDANGNYEFKIDGDRTKYSGSAVAVSLFYDEVPDYGQGDTSAPKNFSTFEVLIDIIHPKWRETNNGLEAGWSFKLTSRVWCYILKRLDIWVICGTVTNCESQQPLSGIEVIAMDDDIITDDRLGSATTKNNGQFCIFYRSIDFKKTFLSPWINMETTPVFSFDNGPDVYFKFAISGSEFFAENPSEAQKPSRKNVGNCLCVALCLKEAPTTQQDPPALFYQIGYNRKYHPVLNIDPATGRTTGKAEASWNDQAFYNTLDLRGSLSQTLNGQPVEYKFQYAKVDDPSFDVNSPGLIWNDVVAGQIAKTEIATQTTQIFPVVKYNSFKIGGTTSPTIYGNEIKVEVTADNWIEVPQYTGGFPFSFNGSLIKLISNSLVLNDTIDVAGMKPGETSVLPAPSPSDSLQKNKYFILRMLKREKGNSATEIQAGFSRALAIFNTEYQNVPQGGSWLPSASNELGIASIDLQELIGGGCNKIVNDIHVKYTAANPNLGSVWLKFTGQGATNTFDPIVFPSPGEEAYGTVSYIGEFGDLKPCAYEILLNVELNLTDGEDQHQGIWDRVLFCR